MYKCDCAWTEFKEIIHTKLSLLCLTCPSSLSFSQATHSLPLYLSTLHLSQGYCCCIFSLIFPLIFSFCSLRLLSLFPFILQSLLAVFISPFISFFLPQTQGVRTHSCACAQLRTNTLEHICLVMLASANLSVGEIKV